MEFPSPLTQAILIKRTKRFLAEVVVNNQEYRTIYCPNMGAMTGCDVLGSRVWFSHCPSSLRKYPDTWELVEVDAGYLVCVNTLISFQLVKEGIEQGRLPALEDYDIIQTTPVSIDNYTYDLSLQKANVLENKSNICYVDVKTVTLGDEIHRGFFPDIKTERAVHQLKGLIHAKRLGYRAVLIFCVQHTGIERLFPADHIDIQFGATLRQAVFAGVEILAYGVEITLKEIEIAKPVELCIPARMICASR